MPCLPVKGRKVWTGLSQSFLFCSTDVEILSLCLYCTDDTIFPLHLQCLLCLWHIGRSADLSGEWMEGRDYDTSLRHNQPEELSSGHVFSPEDRKELSPQFLWDSQAFLFSAQQLHPQPAQTLWPRQIAQAARHDRPCWDSRNGFHHLTELAVSFPQGAFTLTCSV